MEKSRETGITILGVSMLLIGALMIASDGVSGKILGVLLLGASSFIQLKFFRNKKEKQGKLFKVWIFVFVGILLVLVDYAVDSYDKYGKRFNEERAKLGILEIPENWVSKEKGTKTKFWNSENIDEVVKGRIGKEVLINEDNEIYLERDRIINKSGGKHIGLVVSCKFDDEPKFSYLYYELEGNVQVNSRELSKEEFDEKINDWQINLN